MPCELVQSAAAAVWPALLDLRRMTDEETTSEPALRFVCEAGRWRLESQRDARGDQTLEVFLQPQDHATGPQHGTRYLHSRHQAGEEPFVHAAAGGIDRDSESVFRLYLPVLLGARMARREQRAFTTAHIAQTLDGRIACLNGHSQWISNQANLHHAHRLRALHDAVLVGGKTVENDNPQLTVRHVEGIDPTRVVLSARAAFVGTALDLHVLTGPGSTLICSTERADQLAGATDRPLQLVGLDGPGDGPIPPADVLAALHHRGLTSVFLEGGASTVSHFLEAGAIDLLHVHVAPMILGSGISSFSLPEARSIQDGRKLSMEHFSLDGELLLQCRMRPARNGHDGGPSG